MPQRNTRRPKPSQEGGSTTLPALTPRNLAARWMLRWGTSESIIALNKKFFALLRWTCGGLGRLVRRQLAKMSQLGLSKREKAKATKVLKRLENDDDSSLLVGDKLAMLENLLDDFDYYDLKRAVVDDLDDVLREAGGKKVGQTPQARLLQRFFGLEDDAAALCEYAFLAGRHAVISDWFEDCLDIEHYIHRETLALTLGVDKEDCRALVEQLEEMGILDEDRNMRLVACLDQALRKGDENALHNSLCIPFKGETLPLEHFRIPPEARNDVVQLLRCDSETPVQILLYGKPGTGKSTFARSLARELGVRVWAVPCRLNGSIQERRVALMACLQVAKQSSGSFVVVDEAEQLLDTDAGFGNANYSEKAWLNDLLEQPGQRIIWITNKVSHLDQAVRRRFRYSLKFEDLTEVDRGKVWLETARKLGVNKRLTRKEATRLCQQYPVQAAAIENALSCARDIAPHDGFAACVERVLDAHLTLGRGGRSRTQTQGKMTPFNVDCLCTAAPLDDLLRQCRNLDAYLRSGEPLDPGMGVMLFYGPPGTGKSRLARYIAETLHRPCVLKRASDILAPYVGETEQNIANAFASAQRSGAMLVIDEADGFLVPPSAGQRTWERTQANEFLVALENCEGFCVCTTNTYDDLDFRSVRRFSHKVGFTYAKPEQLRLLYELLLCPLLTVKPTAGIWEVLQQQRYLTPGDFSAVRKQHYLKDKGSFGHGDLLKALLHEQKMKLEAGSKRLGFSG